MPYTCEATYAARPEGQRAARDVQSFAASGVDMFMFESGEV